MILWSSSKVMARFFACTTFGHCLFGVTDLKSQSMSKAKLWIRRNYTSVETVPAAITLSRS